MTKANQLSEKWIKASILGTIWASSEIVLGSFLHNLRIPFSGNILTAIGLVILISANYKWKEHGLFWRAGIICALLKTMSPSAVIFGPMIAITSEAFLLEFSVRIMGRSIAGFMLGAILAMSWNLFQKIFNFIIFYGLNIVEVYTNLMEYAQRQLRLQFDIVWAPLILLLIIYAAFGAFSALIGIRTGKKIQNSKPNFAKQKNENTTSQFQKKRDENFSYSLFWLVLNLIFMISPLLLIGKIHFGFWVILVITITACWTFRYKRALRQLVRPKLWIFFILITMLTAFVFTRLQEGNVSTIDAVLIGVEMNLRAILLILGFSVLGTELYHPKIRKFLAQSYFKQLPLALELSLESLPSMIAGVPDFKSIIKNPVQVIFQMMTHADERIEELKNKGNKTSKIIILTGEIGSGKTSCIQNLIQELKSKYLEVQGIYNLRVIENNERMGYDIVDIQSNNQFPFLRTTGNQFQKKIGKFYINYDGEKNAKRILSSIKKTDVLIIDEIGWLELSGGGWSDELDHILQTNSKFIILSVRKDALNEVIHKWKILPHKIFDVSKNNCSEVVKEIAN